MNSNCVKRLKKELASLTDKSNQDDSIQLTPSQESIMQWSAIITAADDSVYFGYRFKLSIEVPMEYPMIPPMIRFVTKIFHPNVLFDSGEICLDILKKEWSPAWSLQSTCRAIITLLSSPAHDSPLNCDAGNMLRAEDNLAFKTLARMYCVEYALPTTS